MKKLRVLFLCHEDLVPPESRDGFDPDAIYEWRAEYCVVTALRELGHEVCVFGASDAIHPIGRCVEEFAPHVVFNQLVELRDVGAFASHVVAYLELLGVPYTGCNPLGLAIARDKALSKKILQQDGIPTPAFLAFPVGKRVRVPKQTRYPMIVKSLDEDASQGVSQDSIVHDAAELAKRVAYVHRKVGSAAIAEAYVAGRELTVGVVGNERLETLPVWELFFRNLPKGTAPIATERVKWDRAYQKKIGVASGPADLPAPLRARIAKIARATFRALHLSGYARLDLRLSPDGEVHVIEANPNADLVDVEDLALAAAHGGMPYPRFIQRILDVALGYGAPGRSA